MKLLLLGLMAALGLDPGCDNATASGPPSSDDTQRAQQERMLQEGTAQTGMPAIKNFRERKLLKDILELRDENGLTTFTYVWSDVKGQWTFFCNSIGYGIPYATQFTNPGKTEWRSGSYGQAYAVAGVVLPQADPNGLFSPASAEGTWVMCKDPGGPDVKPVYLEPRVIVSPFELPKAEAVGVSGKKP
jgi:hypothetical protein